MSSLAITSSAFTADGQIPQRYTCDGENVSPPLAWSGAPSGTASFALAVEDPDAPGGTFLHWLIYDIPATTTALPEGVDTSGAPANLGGAHQGRNGFKGIGYGGPCPPAGPAHHYHVRLFALDTLLGVPAGASREDVTKAMNRHELAQAELVGLYGRKK
ncbi:MAG TPA: YbhB/YbcL family Raf kinase inhibitor-like protein [Gemmatimonadaceae bacterium]|nr:YbhB/YbcL family Raf kinase inhibitor-like protein [Gemmatimonadaceae bacterium]